MERFVVEDSEENPAPPPTTRARVKLAAEPIVARRAKIARWSKCLTFLILWHAVLAVMVFFYARVEAHPLPRSPINSTYHRLLAFTAFSYIFGVVAGFTDVVLVIIFWNKVYPRKRGFFCKLASYIALIFASLVLTGFFYLCPMIFSLIATAPVFEHACNDFWMTVLFTGHKYNNTDQPNTAAFSLSSSPNDVLFTFTSNAPDPSIFSLVDGSIAANASVLPALRQVTFNPNGNDVTGVCLSDNSTCASADAEASPFFTVDVSSQNGVRSVLRTIYKDWSLEDVPSVIMKHVDPSTDALLERVMQTSPGACDHLKVCLDPSAATNNVVNPDVLIALGWLLTKQAAYAVKCTTPHSAN